MGTIHRMRTMWRCRWGLELFSRCWKMPNMLMGTARKVKKPPARNANRCSWKLRSSRWPCPINTPAMMRPSRDEVSTNSQMARSTRRVTQYSRVQRMGSDSNPGRRMPTEATEAGGVGGAPDEHDTGPVRSGIRLVKSQAVDDDASSSAFLVLAVWPFMKPLHQSCFQSAALIQAGHRGQADSKRGRERTAIRKSLEFRNCGTCPLRKCCRSGTWPLRRKMFSKQLHLHMQTR
mmetsp:Transcript_33050/g.62243  ORF Transcript_33050/g.62243 Transcript_33050/m.62243 type:complete len:233 (+) Transcript_33050:1303-2001(+)